MSNAKLTFSNIYQYLQSKGIKCTLTTSGVKVYSEYSFLGMLKAVQGQCIFKGDIPINCILTQYYLHTILNLFKCDKVAFTDYDDYVHYICRIEAIKPTQETVNE